jgi:hypothetical protein
LLVRVTVPPAAGPFRINVGFTNVVVAALNRPCQARAVQAGVGHIQGDGAGLG